MSPYDAVLAIHKIKEISAALGNAPDSIEFIWHGGEPMLMGIEFYKKTAGLLEKRFPKIKFKHTMQSNLLLFDKKKWAGSFAELFHWNVSTSYDFFSSFRQLPSGDDYYEKWKRKLFELRDAGYPSYMDIHSICVLSKQNCLKLNEIHDKIIEDDLGIEIKLNNFYAVGRGALKKDIALTPDEYGACMEKAVRIWGLDNKVSLSQAGQFRNFIESKEGENDSLYKLPCPHYNNCVGYIFGIEPDGAIYNCSEMADISAIKPSFNYIFGNFHKKGLHYGNIATLKASQSIPDGECLKCGICGGGCKKQKLLLNGTLNGKTPYCGAWKRIYKTVKSLLK
ncbi:MAG: Anaerobic sulfatase-maturating enzyme [candidate division WS2 bacterium]|nr:Anaerobic sulfatase-maturating enzyme [Candidatus Lithacetigena glycinireducens]